MALPDKGIATLTEYKGTSALRGYVLFNPCTVITPTKDNIDLMEKTLADMESEYAKMDFIIDFANFFRPSGRFFLLRYL